MCFYLIPGITGLWVSLKVDQTRFEFGFQLGGNLKGVRDGSNAFPNHFNELNALLDGQLQNVGNRNLAHGT